MLLHVLVLLASAWSALGSDCSWQGIPWCGLIGSCGKDHYMRTGFNHGSCILQVTRYCCPKSDGDDVQDVILCEHDQFNGDCIVTSLTGNKKCLNVEKSDWASSVNTLGKCVRLYEHENCEGKSKAYYPGSFGHDNLWEMNDLVTSVGYCYDHDQAKEGCDRAKRQIGGGGCQWAADVLTVGFLPWLRRIQNPNPDSAARWWQIGHNDRVESMEAVIERRHLGRGTDTNPATRDFAQQMGRSNDDAGHILASRLGGLGNDTANIFPQSRNINRGVWAQAEADVANAVQNRGRVRYTVNLEYDGHYETRPFKIVYRVVDDTTGEVLFLNDLVNP
ncbi:unnamed protein product [Bemisia tabaci]|uniref:Type VII secretion system protein EssD-like domain-containing protein n=1 Tax=Bemisia tabaci TaxID=7038 RepID=A0A9P0EWK2_BEMTA|nr:unnamed protein product [Bemisia tabaci]